MLLIVMLLVGGVGFTLFISILCLSVNVSTFLHTYIYWQYSHRVHRSYDSVWLSCLRICSNCCRYFHVSFFFIVVVMYSGSSIVAVIVVVKVSVAYSQDDAYIHT